MSLYGYQPKYKKALWVARYPSQEQAKPVAAPVRRQQAVRALPPRKPIRAVSKAKAVELRLYRQEARAFVAAAKARGERCGVVAAVKELRDGMKYGHPISDAMNEVHHQRGRLGSLLRDQRFWRAVSKQGHRWLHSNINKARAMGFMAAPGEWNKPVPKWTHNAKEK